MRAKRRRPHLPEGWEGAGTVGRYAAGARVLPFCGSSGAPKIYSSVWFFAEKI
jgi:hypothetical protein